MEKYFAKKTKLVGLANTLILFLKIWVMVVSFRNFLPITLTVEKKMITVVHAEVVLIFVPPMRLFQIIKLMQNVFHI